MAVAHIRKEALVPLPVEGDGRVRLRIATDDIQEITGTCGKLYEVGSRNGFHPLHEVLFSSSLASALLSVTTA